MSEEYRYELSVSEQTMNSNALPVIHDVELGEVVIHRVGNHGPIIFMWEYAPPNAARRLVPIGKANMMEATKIKICQVLRSNAWREQEKQNQ